MAEFQIVLHANGEVIEGASGTDYSGGDNMILRLRSPISSMERLRRIICRRLTLDCNQVLSQIIWRCPQFVADGRVSYTAFVLGNDQSVSYMFDYHQSVGNNLPIDVYLIVSSQEHDNVDVGCPGSSSQMQEPTHYMNRKEFMQHLRSIHNGDIPAGSIPVEYASGTDDEVSSGADGPITDDDAVSDTEVQREGCPTIVGASLPSFVTNVDAEHTGIIPFHPDEFGNGLGKNDELRVKMMFRDRNDAVSTIREYNIFRNKHIKVSKSFQGTWEVRCRYRDSGCMWRALVRQKANNRTWQLTRYDFPHSCRTGGVTSDNRCLTSAFIAGSIYHMISKDPSISVPLIQKHIQDSYHLEPRYKRAWYAKQIAISSVYGEWDESYHFLSRWLLALKERSPESVVEWNLWPYFVEGRECPGYAILDKVFWCFSACIEAFKEVRPVIFVDGTHLYGKYEGVLLMATAVDGDNRLIPLAHAIVHKESHDSWPWFLNLVHKHIIKDISPVTIISDRHTSIAHAMTSEDHWKEPNAYWRYCFRHVRSNYRSRVKRNDLADKFYNTAKEWEVPFLERGLQELQEMDPKFLEFRERLGPRSRWTLAWDGGARWGHETTNFAESINGALRGARNLPILALVMKTMYLTIDWFEKRRQDYEGRVERGQIWFDSTVLYIENQVEIARDYIARAIHSPTGRYEVELAPTISRAQALTKYVVSLKDWKCDCNRFQSLRLPCSHAVAACKPRSLDPYNFVHPYYSIERSLRAYSGVFYPLGDKSLWPESPIYWCPDPERVRKKEGRPKSTRYQNDMDKNYGPNLDGTTTTKNRCGFCHESGHTRRKCPLNPGGSAPRV